MMRIAAISFTPPELYGLQLGLLNILVDLRSLGNVHTEVHFVDDSQRIDGKSFDVILMSVVNSLQYPLIFAALKKMDVPFHSVDRTSEYPFVVVGGIGLPNPEPLAEFIDIAVTSPSSESLISIVRHLSKQTPSERDRKSRLWGLTDIPDIYIPSLVNPEFNNDHTIKSIKSRYELHFNKDKTRPRFYCSSDGNGIVSILMNTGCRKKCYFCALTWYWHYVEADLVNIKREVSNLENRNTNTLIVNSASITQHSEFDAIIEYLRKSGHRIVMGSLRADELNDEKGSRLASLNCTDHSITEYSGLSCVDSRMLTFGIETPSRDLLRLLGKNMDPQLVERNIKMMISKGLNRIGLYFMIGLPHERKDDRMAIINFVKNIADENHNNIRGLSIRTNPLVPTPCTPMQRCEYEDVENIERHLTELTNGFDDILRNSHIRQSSSIHVLNPGTYLYETIAYRGDRRTGGLLLELYRRGIKLESLDKPTIENLLTEFGLPCYDFFRRRINPSEILPWQLLIGDTVIVSEREFLTRLASVQSR